MNYIIAIGAFQALLAAVLLWQSKQTDRADRLLIMLLFCIGSHLGIKFCIYNFVSDVHMQLQMNTFIGFCYGPLIYLYALKKKNESFVPMSKWYLFLPFFFGAVGYLTAICVLALSVPHGYKVLDAYNAVTGYAILAVNGVLSMQALRLAGRMSVKQVKEMRLIKQVAAALVLLCILGLASALTKSVNTPANNFLFRSVIYTVLIVICIIIIRFKYVGVLGLQQLDNYQQNTIEQLSALSAAASNPAVADIQAVSEVMHADVQTARKLQLTDEEHRSIFERLEQSMMHTELFTDADLTLDKLAGAIGISRYHLSETLNNYANKSFYHYVNEYRVRRITEQMQRLSNNISAVNMLSLAYDNGFKAKSSFNQYFKKITGNTPTEYLKSLAEAKEHVTMVS